MKTMNWIEWCGAVLLVASLMWTTGCGGSDGDGGSTSTVVVTNSTGGTTTVVVTNAPAPQALVAPQLVSPQNGQEFQTFVLGFSMDIEFEWTAVPGAVVYVLEVDGTKVSVNGTKSTVALNIGMHKWRVWGWIPEQGAMDPQAAKSLLPLFSNL